MDRENEILGPGEVDEQIERAGEVLPDEDVRLIADLHKKYSHYAEANARSLEVAWERIRLSRQPVLQPEKSRIVSLEQAMAARKKGSFEMNNGPEVKKKASMLKRQLSLWAAVLMVAVLVGSMAVVFNLAAHKSVAHTIKKTTVVGSGAPMPATPGIYFTAEEKSFGNYTVSRMDKTSHVIAWSHEIGEASSAPVVEGDTVYISTNDPEGGKNQAHVYVYALNAADGGERWKADLGVLSEAKNGESTTGTDYLGILNTPAVKDGVVYIMQRTGKLYALDAKNGKTNWMYDVKHTAVYTAGGNSSIEQPGNVSVSGGIVYGTILNNLFAVDAQKGRLNWSKPVESNQMLGSPQVANGAVYLASAAASEHHSGETQTGFVYAYDARTGKQIWSHPAGDKVFGDPTIVDGVVYFGTFGFNVYALKASTGAEIWHYTTPGEVYASPLVDKGVVYVQQLGDGTEVKDNTVKPSLIALKVSDGSKLWSREVSETPYAILDGVIYAGVWPRTLATFSTADGSDVWNQQVGTDLIDKYGGHNGSVPGITVIP